jgi:hypothetical protein
MFISACGVLVMCLSFSNWLPRMAIVKCRLPLAHFVPLRVRCDVIMSLVRGVHISDDDKGTVILLVEADRLVRWALDISFLWIRPNNIQWDRYHGQSPRKGLPWVLLHKRCCQSKSSVLQPPLTLLHFLLYRCAMEIQLAQQLMETTRSANAEDTEKGTAPSVPLSVLDFTSKMPTQGIGWPTMACDSRRFREMCAITHCVQT